MMASTYTKFEVFAIILMLGSGSLNTIVVKWQSKLLSKNSVGVLAPYSHPFLQSAFMFLGQMFCLGSFYSKICWQGSRKSFIEKNIICKGEFLYRISILTRSSSYTMNRLKKFRDKYLHNRKCFAKRVYTSNRKTQGFLI